MIDLSWANEQQPRGHTKEQIEQSRQQQSQTSAASYQQSLAEARRLRATAQQLVEVPGLSGPARAALQNALEWPLDAPHVAEAVQQLRDAVDWGNRDYSLAGMAPVAPIQQRAVEAARPKALTDKERLDRIEKRLGLS